MGCSQQDPRSQQLPRATARAGQVSIGTLSWDRETLCGQLDLQPKSDWGWGGVEGPQQDCFCGRHNQPQTALSLASTVVEKASPPRGWAGREQTSCLQGKPSTVFEVLPLTPKALGAPQPTAIQKQDDCSETSQHWVPHGTEPSADQGLWKSRHPLGL